MASSAVQSKEKVDATTSCTINIRREDVEGAVPEDGGACVAARCAKRALGAQHVYFYRGTAYIEFDEDSPVERFVPSSALRRDVIEPLDELRFEDIKTGRYDLLPPPKSNRLGVAAQKRRERERRRELGLMPPAKQSQYTPRPMIGRVRSA